MQSSTIKNSIISVLLVTTLSCSYNYYKASQELDRINAILEPMQVIVRNIFVKQNIVRIIMVGIVANGIISANISMISRIIMPIGLQII